MTAVSNETGRVDELTTLAEQCREILEWHKTGNLADGEVRRLAAMMQESIPEHTRLHIAENKIASDAMKYVRQAALSAAPDTKPFAYTMPGDDIADANGFIPVNVVRGDEFTKPLYAAPVSGHFSKLQALWLALNGGPHPRCRDCADHDGTCPNDHDLPCDPQERALEQIRRLRSAPVAQEPVAHVSNDRCKLDDDPAPVASVTQVCSCSEICAADGFTSVSKPAPQYDALGRRMEPVAMPDAQKDALARCYGRLWLVHTDNKSIHLARRELLSWLTKDEQAWGIEHAKTEALAWPSHTSPRATPAGLGADEIARICDDLAEDGHCGESMSEKIARQRRNTVIHEVKSALLLEAAAKLSTGAGK